MEDTFVRKDFMPDSKTVLYVSEEHISAEYMKQLLEEIGFQFEHFSSTSQLLDYIENPTFTPLVVVMKQWMPCNSEEFFEESAEGRLTGVVMYKLFAKKFPFVPVILLTEEDLRGKLEQSETLNFRRFIEFGPQKLLDTVRYIASKSQ